MMGYGWRNNGTGTTGNRMLFRKAMDGQRVTRYLPCVCLALQARLGLAWPPVRGSSDRENASALVLLGFGISLSSRDSSCPLACVRSSRYGTSVPLQVLGSGIEEAHPIESFPRRSLWQPAT